jgi:UDP-N-acetylglucosamine 2-epimerase (hydrolysing)
MFSNSFKSQKLLKAYYQIDFEKFAIVMFHPVTTEVNEMEQYTDNFVNCLLTDDHNYVVVYPNNDLGSKYIISAFKRLKNNN